MPQALPRIAARAAALVALLVLVAGCSEKPQGTVLRWEQIPEDRLGGPGNLHGVVAFSADDVWAVGFVVPEFSLVATPIALHRAGGVWTRMDLPVPAGQSVQVHACAVDGDGTIWACGFGQTIPGEQSTSRPYVVRRTGGVWSLVSLDGLGNLGGIELQGIAARGAGEALEVRAVGTSLDGVGVALRYAGGTWERLALPAPAGDPSGAVPWDLFAVTVDRNGAWYAAGAVGGGVLGGALYVDQGAGWHALPGPGTANLTFTALAFDPRGTLWLGAIVPFGDATRGALYRLDPGAGAPGEVPIARTTSGFSNIYGLGFDVYGHGWAVGSRAPDDVFVVGNPNGIWTETAIEAERETGASGEQEGGGSLFAVAVITGQTAYAVGGAAESDPEGGFEYRARLFELMPRPAGETDAPQGPIAP